MASVKICSDFRAKKRWNLSLFTPFPPALNLSQHQGLFWWIRLFASRWPKYWSFSFSISPPNEYSGLISLKMDLFDLLVVQETLRSLLQHSNKGINYLALRLLYDKLSQSYVTIGKTTALTIWTFVNKVMSLIFNTLSRFVITFLPRSKHLLISWLQ